MSNIEFLPLYVARIGVEIDEDLIFGFSFRWIADRSPLDLKTISFTAFASREGSPVASMIGQVFGAADDRIVFSAFAADRGVLTPGCYDLTIMAQEGSFHQRLLGRSSLTIGRPRHCVLTPMNGNRMSDMVVIPPGLILASPPQLAAALVQGLPDVQTGGSGVIPAPGNLYIDANGVVVISQEGANTLMSTIVSLLPDVRNGDAVPPAGSLFINASGFVALSI